MKIAFFGASDLGWTCCRELIGMGQQVVGIFTIPETFSISWSDRPVRNVRYRSFDSIGTDFGIPVLPVEGKDSTPRVRASLRTLKPDLIVAIGWYYVLPASIRSLAPLGAVGLHASLLPRYRGGAPLVWAIINGEHETGVSLFYLEDGVDTGDIVAQARFPIHKADAISDLVARCEESSLDLVRTYIPRLGDGTAPRVPQQEDRAMTVPQRRPEDGWIDWTRLSSVEVCNWVRAQSRPYPGAFTFRDGEKVTIWKASRMAGDDDIVPYPPGTIAMDGEMLTVVCADNLRIRIDEAETASGLPFDLEDGGTGRFVSTPETGALETR